MPKKTNRDYIADNLAKLFEDELKSEIRRRSAEARAFQRMTGARLAVDALLRAGAIRDDLAPLLREWYGLGGIQILVVGGVQIVPPELS